MSKKRSFECGFISLVIWAFISLFAVPTFGINAKTSHGPALAVLDGDLFLFFKGHENENIWHSVLRGRTWESLGRVNDQHPPHMEQNPSSMVSWAFTREAPSVVARHVPRLAQKWNYLVYRGHNNTRVWYTTQKWHTTFGGTVYYKWERPKTFQNADTQNSPSAVNHLWGTVNKLTVAFTGIDDRIYLIMGDALPVALPEEAQTREGPTIVSFNNHLYIFYIGVSMGDERIHVAKAQRNTRGYMNWQFSTLPRAFTTSVIAVVNYQGTLVVAYSGHNNDHIWLRSSSDGVNWNRLGYIENVTTDYGPALAVYGDTLYLAFKPPYITDGSIVFMPDYLEVCAGTLVIESTNSPDTAGHVWSSIRYDRPALNCGE